MSEYVSFKNYIGLDLFGDSIEVPENSDITMKGDYLVYDNKYPICVDGSEECINYFVYNGDGNAYERLRHLNIIVYEPRVRHWNVTKDTYDEFGNVNGTEDIIEEGRFAPYEMVYIKEHFNKYILDGPVLIFNKEFYKAPIVVLAKLSSYLEENLQHELLSNV